MDTSQKKKKKMKLKEKINIDFINAMKSKDAVTKSLLSVIKGEIQTVEKNVGSTDLSDEEVTKILNKTAKSLKETISLSGDEKSKTELVIVESYLPKQMTKEEIAVKVKELIENGANNIGAVMKEFSTLPADKKIVGEVIREML